MMETASCIDIGANLTHPSFARDVQRVIGQARTAGVQQMIVTGTTVENSRAAQDLAAQFPGILMTTVGIHPHDARHYAPPVLGELRQLAAGPAVVAIGECGLDYHRDFSPRDQQRTCFEAHLELAAELGLPLFLHERDAHGDFLGRLREWRPRLGGIVVHCFTGSAAEARAYLDLDLHLGITGWICDERRGVHLREIVAAVPLERMMIETDSPFLAPRDVRPKVHRNEPRFLPHILGWIARCRSADLAETAAAIRATTRSFFRLPEPPV